MKMLAFTGRTRVREARFEERSLLPRKAVCAVASSMRERLTALFETNAIVSVSEPAIPPEAAWCEIARDAFAWCVRSSGADAAIVLGNADAIALVSAAFGESPARGAVRPLSAIEREVLERIASGLADSLVAACGPRDRRSLERIATLAGFETYFDVLLEAPVGARIGIALRREPEPECPGSLGVDDIADVAVVPVASLDLGFLAAGGVAKLVPGAVLPITSSGALRGSLRLGGRTLARGTCGVINGRYAIAVEGT